jgi:shikimate dehydrogenase
VALLTGRRRAELVGIRWSSLHFPDDPGSAIAITLLEPGVRELIIHDTNAARLAALLELVADVGRSRVSTSSPGSTGCDMVYNATSIGMAEGDPLPVAVDSLASSMFVGDVIARHSALLF